MKGFAAGDQMSDSDGRFVRIAFQGGAVRRSAVVGKLARDGFRLIGGQRLPTAMRDFNRDQGASEENAQRHSCGSAPSREAMNRLVHPRSNQPNHAFEPCQATSPKSRPDFPASFRTPSEHGTSRVELATT